MRSTADASVRKCWPNARCLADRFLSLRGLARITYGLVPSLPGQVPIPKTGDHKGRPYGGVPGERQTDGSGQPSNGATGSTFSSANAPRRSMNASSRISVNHSSSRSSKRFSTRIWVA